MIDSGSAARQLYKEQLEVIFRSWIAVSPELDELAATRPLLAETGERRNELPRLGLLGLQSLGYIEANAAPPPGWTAAEKELLQNAADHTGMVDFVVLTPLKKLFDTASKP